MKSWKDIKIDFKDFEKIKQAVIDHYEYNPGCHLIKYWSERINERIEKETRESGNLGYGFVGDGWPQKMDQTKALQMDALNFQEAYSPEDLHCRDVGDSLYQANKLFPYLKEDKQHYYIMDFGAGYGRLSIPFIHRLGKKVTYIGVDYVPVSLLIAPQFVSQATNAKTRKWNGKKAIENFQFVSLPAWRLDEIEVPIDIFISIHSFQEMEFSTIDYFVNFSHAAAAEHAIFYSINITGNRPKGSWKLLYDAGYPINRDGPYNEKLWRIN